MGWRGRNKTTQREGENRLAKQTLLEIESGENLIQGQKDEEICEKNIKIEADKQVAIEKARIELEKAHKEERKRELEHLGPVV